MSAPCTSAAPAVQATFFATLFGVLLTREAARVMLDDLSDERLMAMLDTGELRAIDIAVAPGTRRELRVWRWSIEAYLMPAVRRAVAKSGPPAIASLLPHARPSLWRAEVDRLLGCSADHTMRLVHAGALRHRRDGSERLYRIEAASLAAFLIAREVQP